MPASSGQADEAADNSSSQNDDEPAEPSRVPSMFAILQKSYKSVNAEDLELLQNEIEKTLVEITTKRWELERELLTLDSPSPDSAPAVQPSALNQSLKHKRKRLKLVKIRTSPQEVRPNKKQFHRSNAPDKLWPFVEQFCAAPTEEQMKSLEEMIESMEQDRDYYKVPALGKKEPASSSCPSSQKGNNNNNTFNNTINNNNNNNSNKNTEHDINLGALTQRLVSSLMEESEDTSNDTTSMKSATGQNQKKKPARSKNCKGINANNAKNLEKRIRQELEEYEILNHSDDIPFTSEDDEILRELVACQHELLSIQQQNKISMERLLKRAKKYTELEVEREKLRVANAEVISAYQRIIQAKQRRRNPSEKEKEAAVKALKVQEAIFNRCDELYLTGNVC